MADFPAYEIEMENLLEEGIREPIPTRDGYDMSPMDPPTPPTDQYLISAWNLTTLGYETWVSSDPNSAAPSGNPTGQRTSTRI